ncbi:cell division protein FtsQ/DivIB [Thalassolituus sp.]|uniref:cell division protein FtsQ/DivIB n=1 Tax=Thalassolituus sp. TaxID=2030822 RepID=UPI0035137779
MSSKKSAARRGATRKVEPKPKRSLKLVKPDWLKASLLGWLALPIVLGGLFLGSRQLMDHWVINQVDVRGDMIVWNAQDLEKQVAWVVGEGFYSADLNAVYDVFINMPLIKDVQVRKRWPDYIEITVSEDIPMAVWNGRQLIGIRGDLMAIPGHLNVDNLTAVTGNSEYLSDSIKHFRLIQQAMGTENIKIEQLTVSDTGSLSMTLSNQWQVQIGRSQLEQRALRLKKLIAGLPSDEVAAVDLRYGKGAAIAWREKQEKG